MSDLGPGGVAEDAATQLDLAQALTVATVRAVAVD